ncbi:hypothetical protein JG687_00013459 [Phytophthora cactorum]|uniref:Uncharacterized protein n=1 Tax=Phytophthora cactorum TaxID=29920 RepID=A0A8T1U1D8_9STRA|nr:hypothetical protein JG687_00013459 [Phytophthora cactorum]
MNGFFTDNQTKQKAYDRYYNAMARSDFVQGAKLKGMIQQQSLDEASSDSLAKLFQQVMNKSRDYDYDKITSKLTKKAPSVIKGEDVKKTKAFTYVPEQTDTHARQKDSPLSYEEAINDENFKKHMNGNELHKINQGNRSGASRSKSSKEVLEKTQRVSQQDFPK